MGILNLSNFTPCSSFSIVNLEQVNAGWDSIKVIFMQKNRFFQKPCFYFLMTYLYGHPTKFNIFLGKRLVFLDCFSFLRLWSERSKFCLAKIIYLLYVSNKEKQIKLFENQDGRRRRTCAFVFNKKVCIGEKPVPNC